MKDYPLSVKYAITAAVFGLDVFVVPPIAGALIGGLMNQAIILMLALAASIYVLAMAWED